MGYSTKKQQTIAKDYEKAVLNRDYHLAMELGEEYKQYDFEGGRRMKLEIMERIEHEAALSE